MRSKNDEANHLSAVANYFQTISLFLLALLAFAITVASSLVAAQPVQINGNICSGGNRTPALVSISPTDGNTTIEQTSTLEMTLDWVNSVTVKKGAVILGTATGNNTANQILSIPVSLTEGPNNLTISLTGGCPINTTSTSYALTYVENAATLTYKTTNVTSPRLTGAYKPLGSKVFATINGSTYEATTLANGTWELPANTITPDLPEGSYDIYIEQKDPSDAVVFSRTYTGALVIDTTVPLGSVISSQSDSRSPEVSGIVNDPDATIEVALNGGTYEATNNRDGTWTLPAGIITPQLASGDYEVVVTITDKAGNITTIRSTLTINAPNELGFILAPNTGYIRIGSFNLASWIVYALLLIIAATIIRHKLAQKPDTVR
jgi:hypothetical protein